MPVEDRPRIVLESVVLVDQRIDEADRVFCDIGISDSDTPTDPVSQLRERSTQRCCRGLVKTDAKYLMGMLVHKLAFVRKGHATRCETFFASPKTKPPASSAGGSILGISALTQPF